MPDEELLPLAGAKIVGSLTELRDSLKGARMIHEFTMTLDEITDITASLENAIFRAGMDDATVSLRNGEVRVAFAREAESMVAATNEAYAQMERAGLRVKLLTMNPAEPNGGAG